MKKQLVGYIRKSKSGKMWNLTGKKDDLDKIETFDSNDGTVKFRIGLFEQDIKEFLAGKTEYVRVIQLQDEE